MPTPETPQDPMRDDAHPTESRDAATRAQRGTGEASHRGLDGIDITRSIIAVVAIILLIAGFIFAMNSDRTSKPMLINGDTLGAHSGETLEQYQARAAGTLAEASQTQAQETAEHAFGLVTFAEPLSASEAAELLAGLDRVNAVLTEQNLVPVAIPEPTANETRVDVFRRWVGDEQIIGVVAWATAEQFRDVAVNQHTFAVEVLPADAAWGRFGVRPVIVGGA